MSITNDFSAPKLKDQEKISSPITIHLKTLQGREYTYRIDRESKAIALFKLIFKDTSIHPCDIKLIHKNKQICPLGDLNEHLQSDVVDFNFFMTERFGHWRTLENAVPKEMFSDLQKAISNYPNQEGNLVSAFISKYKKIVDNAMQEKI